MPANDTTVQDQKDGKSKTMEYALHTGLYGMKPGNHGNANTDIAIYQTINTILNLGVFEPFLRKTYFGSVNSFIQKMYDTMTTTLRFFRPIPSCVALLAIFSCTAPMETAAPPPPSNDLTTSIETPVICAHSDSLPRDTANKMVAQWATEMKTANRTTTLDPMNLYRVFSASEVLTFLNRCQDCDGVRLYFGFHEAPETFPSAPDLLMVNEMACTDQIKEAADILVSQSAEPAGTAQIAIDKCQQLTTMWRSELNKRSAQYTLINAYNFQHNELKAMASRPGVEEIRMSFALRKMGGTFAVDVVYEGYPVNPNARKPFVDFANPCPLSCDENSKLMQMPGR